MSFRIAVVPALLSLLFLSGSLQDPGQDRFPDLEGALLKIRGCLGVETAQTSGGKQLIFAWFEDKRSVLRWYNSPTHRQVMGAFVADGADLKKPLEHIEEGTGPIMVVASLTMSEEEHFEALTLPVSQIAIELYQPLPGGSYLGSRFTPKAVPVAHSRDLGAGKGDKSP